jgi:hypothetical protein
MEKINGMKIYCCGCQHEVNATLVDGSVVYPRRPDLASLPFWQCPECKNFVGCHHKTKKRTKPLGVIADDQIKAARRHIHAILDPLWQTGLISRKTIYSELTRVLGYQYHTAEIKTLDEARLVYRAVKAITRLVPDPSCKPKGSFPASAHNRQA